MPAGFKGVVTNLAGKIPFEPEHYAVLVDIAKQPENAGRNDVITRLVDGGALLEYNTGRWRQPHPVVRLLPGYKKAEAAAQNPVV